MLRRLLIAYGVLCLIGAVILLVAHVTIALVIYLAINGLIITGGILLERSSYRSKADTKQGKWQSTGERFKDPTSGKLIEVYYNPQTGERDYRESEKGDLKHSRNAQHSRRKSSHVRRV